MRPLRQGTTVTVPLGPYLDDTDAATAETGLTPTPEVSKNHGAFVARNSATAITHDADGWYRVELDATDTGTIGPLTVKDKQAGALPIWDYFYVYDPAVFDALFAGTTPLDVGDVLGSVLGDVQGEVLGSVFGDVQGNLLGSVFGDVQGNVDGTLATVGPGAITPASFVASAIAAAALAPDVAAELQAGLATAGALAALQADALAVRAKTDALSVTGGKVTPIDVDGLTFASAMELLLAVLAGVTVPAGTTVAFKKRDGTTTKLTITYGAADGQRIASVLS